MVNGTGRDARVRQRTTPPTAQKRKLIDRTWGARRQLLVVVVDVGWLAGGGRRPVAAAKLANEPLASITLNLVLITRKSPSRADELRKTSSATKATTFCITNLFFLVHCVLYPPHVLTLFVPWSGV